MFLLMALCRGKFSLPTNLGVMSPQLQLQESLSPHVTAGHKNLCGLILFKLFPRSYDGELGPGSSFFFFQIGMFLCIIFQLQFFITFLTARNVWACMLYVHGPVGARGRCWVLLSITPPPSFETESLAEHGVSQFWLDWQPASPSEPSVSAQLAPLLLQAGMAMSGFLCSC